MDSQKYISQVSQLRRMVVVKASSLINDENDVEDIAQEVLLKIWERLDKLSDDNDKVFAYATKITKNICLNRLRKKRRHPILRLFHWYDNDGEENEDYTNMVGTSITPLHITEDKEMDALFSKALKRLPFNWQRVLIMRNIEERSFGEIAQILGTTESSVRGILSKARQRMIEQLNHV